MATLLTMAKRLIYDLEDFMDGIEEGTIYHDTEENYSKWIYNSITNSYSPALKVEVKDKLQSGIYKINNDMECVRQKVSSDDLYILPDLKIQTILDEVDKFWNRKDKFKQYNFIHKRGILLEGPPGTGKTSILTLLAKDLVERDGVIFLVNSILDFSKIYEYLKSTFKKIEPTRNVITIIEDIDKLATSAVSAELLDFLDGKASISNHLIIATTNNTNDIPDSFIRPSRLDSRFLIDLPSYDCREKFFELKGIDSELLEMYSKESKGLSMSQLKELFIGTIVIGNKFEEVLESLKNPLKKRVYDSTNDDNNIIDLND